MLSICKPPFCSLFTVRRIFKITEKERKKLQTFFLRGLQLKDACSASGKLGRERCPKKKKIGAKEEEHGLALRGTFISFYFRLISLGYIFLFLCPSGSFSYTVPLPRVSPQLHLGRIWAFMTRDAFPACTVQGRYSG